ncbi:hypothetical protein [Ekhidna sp. To15]|uniref:hypothetical protein n=1 Tax=Ekhidna sp. To15 TaxID=3395267 RepID=UPI003F51BEA4
MLSIFKLSSRSSFLTELLLTLLFSGLSLSLGLLYNADQGVADFRESPLLILIFYLKNPFFIILSALITSFANYGSYITTFSMHFVGLVAAWFFVKWLKIQTFSRINRGISWMSFIVVYYGVFVIPTWILVRCGILGMSIVPEASMQSMGLTAESNFFQLYTALFNSAKYEVITTISVTGLYLMELESRRILVKNNQTLENLVTKRTKELATANDLLRKLNKKLILKNNEIQTINVNLDELAKERSKKIQLQMQALSNYAQINSHEVRAPLARILSIAKQLEDVSEMRVKEELVNSVHESADELDKVIRKINRILTA